MEAKMPPLVIPIWLSGTSQHERSHQLSYFDRTGFDTLMPGGREFPWKYIPRLGAKLNVSVGEQIPFDEFRTILESPIYENDDFLTPLQKESHLSRNAIHELKVMKMRSQLTAVVQQALESLGRKVSGNLLGSTVSSAV